MKEKLLKGRNLKRLLSVVLVLAMMVTWMPLNNITAFADDSPPICECRNTEHITHFYVYAIDDSNVYIYLYSGSTYKGSDSCDKDEFLRYWGLLGKDRWYSEGTNGLDYCYEAHIHTYNMTEWTTDARYHWHAATCAHTTQKDSYGYHDFTGQPAVDAKDGLTHHWLCMICEAPGIIENHDFSNDSCQGLCSECGAKNTNGNHDFPENKYYPDKNNQHHRSCALCQYNEDATDCTVSENSIDKLIKKPTCTEEGSHYEITVCKDCGQELSKEIKTDNALGHIGGIATCQIEAVCTRCNNAYGQLADHDYAEEFLTDKAASCTVAGSKSKHCKTDGCDSKTEVTEIPKIAHTPAEAVKENIVEATTKAEGSYDEVIRCSVCNTVISSKTIIVPKIVPEVTATPTPAAEPETTASPSPTAEPEVTATPTPVAEPETTASPSPTAEPEVTATPTPAAEPETTASPSPTAEPEVTATPTPTAEPETTASPSPTAEPEVTATPTPTAEPEKTASSSPSATQAPSTAPTQTPTAVPTIAPTLEPTKAPEVSAGDDVKDEKGTGDYEVVSADKKQVSYEAPVDTKEKTVTVPDSITVNGDSYKVTEIGDKAFKKNMTVTKVTAGKNITTIGKEAFSGADKLETVTIGNKLTTIEDNAFKGCKKLKTITIKSTKLTDKNVSKKAFKGITAKTTIKVPKKKLAAYKTLFKKNGLSAKVKVVAI